jgi:hypothetical protein
VATILQIQFVAFKEKYPRLPIPEGRRKDGKF